MSIMGTGGTGFIGARIIQKLVERGQEVVCFDLLHPRATPRAWARLEAHMDHITVYSPGDVTHMTHVQEAVQAHDVHKIIHMAALLPPITEERPHYGMYVNIQGANNVFEVARWTGIERVVYASSIACYGVQETYGQRPVTEDDISNPVNVYGMTKAANDFAAQKYIQRFGLDLRGIRICTVFGHGRTTGMTGLIGGLLPSLPAIGEPIDLPFDPTEPSPYDIRRGCGGDFRSGGPQ